MATRIPHLLEPYLGPPPPPASLLLLTGVLGSTTNWLVQRYLYSLLSTSSPSSGDLPTQSPQLPRQQSSDQAGSDLQGIGGSSASNSHDDDTRVVLVSFLRDHAFWRDAMSRLGIDLNGASNRGRFVFVDAMSELFAPPAPPSTTTTTTQSKHHILTKPTVSALRKVLGDALADIQQSVPGGVGVGGGPRTVLILDQPDLLLAAAAGVCDDDGNDNTGDDCISSQSLQDLLLDVRERVHSSIVTLSADDPLIASQETSLETEHASFALSLAHAAYLIVSLRLLDTGHAKDVSGVLRITPGGDSDDVEAGAAVDEKELLYFVGGDGAVKVFERGQ